MNTKSTPQEAKYNPKLNIGFTLTLFFFYTALFAQAPAIQWASCIGGTGMEGASFEYNTANSHYGLQVIQTADGGYITAGNADQNSGYVTGVHNSTDMWVVKISSTGVFQWQKALGSQGYDTAAAIAQTTDGGYIVAGYAGVEGGDVTSNHGAGEMWVVRLNGSGTLLWQKCLGGNGTDKAFSIKPTSDGGFIVTGIEGSNNGDITAHHAPLQATDMWVVKIDSIGTLQWQKSLGGMGDEVGYSVQQTSDGGYIVAGSTLSKDGDVVGNHIYWDTGSAAYKASLDYWVVKLDGTGTLQWQKCLGGIGEDTAYSIQQTSDGGYIVAGRSTSINGDVTGNHGMRDFWVVKLNGSGILQWQKSLGGANNDSAAFIQQTTDGGYIVAGNSMSNDGDVSGNHGTSTSTDYWVVKLNPDGTLQWQKALGGTNSDMAFSVQQTTDGGYVVAGTTKSQNGDVSGLHYNVDATDFWIVKLAADQLATGNFSQQEAAIYPNPVKEVLYLTATANRITITDISGKVLSIQNNVSQINLSTLIKGTYLITIEQENGVKQTKKVIKE